MTFASTTFQVRFASTVFRWGFASYLASYEKMEGGNPPPLFRAPRGRTGVLWDEFDAEDDRVDCGGIGERFPVRCGARQPN